MTFRFAMPHIKMNPARALLAVLLGFMVTTTLSPAAHAQSDRPGYVDLARLGALDALFDADPVIEVNIEGALLRLVAEASRLEDEELAEMLTTLDGIYVRGYDARNARYDDIVDRMRAMGDELESDGWQTIVKVRDRSEAVFMYVMMRGEDVDGMAVMVAERGADEIVFLNIVGDIDPAQIGRIGQKFKIGDLDY